jgi:hypothetical protein
MLYPHLGKIACAGQIDDSDERQLFLAPLLSYRNMSFRSRDSRSIASALPGIANGMAVRSIRFAGVPIGREVSFVYRSGRPENAVFSLVAASDSQRLKRFIEKIDHCAEKNVMLCSPPKISRLAWRQAGLPSSWHC